MEITKNTRNIRLICDIGTDFIISHCCRIGSADRKPIQGSTFRIVDVAMEEARQDSFDFLVCNLAHPVYKRQLLHQLVCFKGLFEKE